MEPEELELQIEKAKRKVEVTMEGIAEAIEKNEQTRPKPVVLTKKEQRALLKAEREKKRVADLNEFRLKESVEQRIRDKHDRLAAARGKTTEARG